MNTYDENELFYKYYDKWIKIYKEGAVRNSTMKKYKLTLGWLKKIGPNVKLKDINRITYQEILNKYAENHERQSTLDFHHQVKSAILDAVDEGFIAKDPTRKAIIKGKIPREKKDKYLNQFELQKLINDLDLKDDINFDWLIYLIAKTGLRFSEALALTPKDFDFPHQLLNVDKKGIYKNTSINTLQSLKPEDYPILTDLYNFLPEYSKGLTSNEKKKIIEQLDILLSRFLTGTDSYLFDGYTNINLDNDLIAFNLQELLYSENQRLINTQTLNLLTYLNNSIVANKINNDKVKLEDRKHVIIVADEFHLFIDENNFEVLRNFGQLARRIRKYSGSLIVATQSIKDFVGSNQILRHSTAIFNNCQYQMIGMLKEDDLKAYLDLFKQNPLTDTQKSFLLTSKRGEFLLNIDSKTRLRVKVEATEIEREMMGEN